MKCWLVWIAILGGCGGSSSGRTDGGGAGDGARADGAAAGDAATGDAPAPGDASGPADAPPGPPWLVAPTASCPAPADACAATATVPGLFASYRKDAYLDDTVYKELGDAPLTGGRVQIAGLSAVTGRVTKVLVDGVDVASILTPVAAPSPTTVPFEWAHVWPASLTAGAPLWVAFHSRASTWDTRTSARLRIETDHGVAVDADFPVVKTPAPITYVTTTDDLGALVVHVRNLDAQPHTVARLLVGGRDVLGAGVACVPTRTLAAGAEAMWTVPLCAPAHPGDPWTVVVDWADAPDAVGVGRVLRPFFPLETWENSGECPFAGGNAANQARVAATGIDTFFFDGGTCNGCGCDARTVVSTLMPTTAEEHGLVNADLILGKPVLADTSRLAGLFTGDESDGEYYAGGVPVAAQRADTARQLWDLYPDVPVYNGGKTNKHVGTFAGMADVQGMDLYVAACAPHITMFGAPPPLRGAYDYLRNTRDNHLPGTTWLYAQGLHKGWNKKNPLTGEIYHVQPDPVEILVQAMSVVAAGGKGFMWFQSNLAEADAAPARWQAMSDATHLVRRVRHLLRVGDPTGAVDGGPGVLAEAIRAPGALVVPVIDLKTTATVDDVACQSGYLTGTFPHWQVGAVSAQVRIPVPADLGVLDVFEVTPTGVAEVTKTISGRDVVISAALDQANPVRLFVVASSPDERARVRAAAP